MEAWKVLLAAVLCFGLVCSVGFMGCSDDDDSAVYTDEVCDDEIDNDLDGCVDMIDADCGGIETDCHDGLDNDCDECADDIDLDCAGGFCFIAAAN